MLSALKGRLIKSVPVRGFCLITKRLKALGASGSGKSTVRPSEALRDFARAQGCALEVQATAAAVSTYNVLSQEGRRVVAALLPEDAESGPSGFGSYFPI